MRTEHIGDVSTSQYCSADGGFMLYIEAIYKLYEEKANHGPILDYILRSKHLRTTEVHYKKILSVYICGNEPMDRFQ